MNKDHEKNEQDFSGLLNSVKPLPAQGIAVTVLTGGGDKPYAFGLILELLSKGAVLEVIGSDQIDCPEFHCRPRLNFMNLRGDQRPNVNLPRKVIRVSVYYAKLLSYAARAKSRIFHILWNNKFELFDRTLLTLYYKLLRKKIVLTAHNVNAGKRDCNDTRLNRLTLRAQYRLADHIFVHTERMKLELTREFGVREARITVIPLGINNSIPSTGLAAQEAKQRFGIRNGKRTILFFGRIRPYKGLEYLITAFQQVANLRDDYRLIIAGLPERGYDAYFAAIRESIQGDVSKGRILLRADFIPDEMIETYFKAADVLVLPYRHIYQSGLLALGYSFGLPVLAADVGSLKDEIVEGKTGFVFRPEDSVDLAATIERYFESDLFRDLNGRRQEIQSFARLRHSWDVVGSKTMAVYASLLESRFAKKLSSHNSPKGSLSVNSPQ